MSESEPKTPKPGKILTNKYEKTPRELSPLTAWLDLWQQDSVAAIDNLFDLGNKNSYSGMELHYLLTAKEPIIPLEQFEEAALEWLQQSTHDWYQYEELFRGLELKDKFLCPKILGWFMANIETLKQIPGPPHAAWTNILDELVKLKQGK